MFVKVKGKAVRFFLKLLFILLEFGQVFDFRSGDRSGFLVTRQITLFCLINLKREKNGS